MGACVSDVQHKLDTKKNNITLRRNAQGNVKKLKYIFIRDGSIPYFLPEYSTSVSILNRYHW